MALGGQIVDLVWLDFFDESLEYRTITQITKVKCELLFFFVRVAKEMFDAPSGKCAVATNDAMYFVAFFDQEFCQV